MESTLIWAGTFFVIVLFLVPYVLKTRRLQAVDKERKKEAQRLGADRAIAQHPQIDALQCIGCASCVQACPEGGVLGIVDGRATIINGLKCVGHGLCAEACPVGAIQVGLGNIHLRDDIPQLNEHRETNISGLFIAGELGGLALIRNAISQGREIVEYIAQNRLKKETSNILDLVIVGAGPAGMSASLEAQRNGLRFVTVDQQDAGGTILQYPKKKLVLTKPVEIPLYGQLTKNEYEKEELLEIWQKLRIKYNLPIRTQNKLVEILNLNDTFELKCQYETYRSYYVILALGRRGTPRKLNVPGEQLPKVAYQLQDALSFRNERILIVGGGDSAIEAAMALANQPGNAVTISYRKDTFFRIKKRNEQKLQPFLEAQKINVLFNSEVVEIHPDKVVVKEKTAEKILPNDRVFVFVGGEPPFELLKKTGIRFGGEQKGNKNPE